MSRDELNRILAAVITTVDEMDYAPETSLYLGLGCDIEKWNLIKNLLVSGGLITCSSSMVSITLKGHELACSIYSSMKKSRDYDPDTCLGKPEHPRMGK